MPITDGDVPYVRAKEKELNAMIAAQAAANGAQLLDWYTASIGHDAVQAAGDPLGRAGGARERRRARPPEPGRDDRRERAPYGGAQVGRLQRTW